MIDRLQRALSGLTRVMAYIGIAALMGAIVVVVGDIIWRRIGGGSFIGAVDLTQFCVMAAAAWSIPYAFAHQAHVSVDLFGERIPSCMSRWLAILAALMSALLCAFLLYLSWQRAMEQWTYGDVSQDLAIPMIAFWVFLLSGLAISVLVNSVMLLQLMCNKSAES